VGFARRAPERQADQSRQARPDPQGHAALSSARISPTAHYTSYVWVKHGLSHEALGSQQGRAYYYALWPLNRLWDRVGAGRSSLETYLLHRHRAIDERLSAAIESGEVGQVLEIAAGLSARGVRFAERYPDVRYVDGDLPHMAADKRARLAAAGLARPNHEVVELDALSPDGLAERLATFDGAHGTAIVTEGLIGYFDRPQVQDLWSRMAAALDRFPRGLYVTDLYIAGEVAGSPTVRVFRQLLQAFVRGKTYTQADTADEARAQLAAAGFAEIALDRADWVRIVSARLVSARAA
jgi:O-methyltransferase involved in polyketide biosynthesis